MKAYTDIKQSKKLAEILPIESSDHHYVRKIQDSTGNPVDGEWSTPKYGDPNSSHANYMVLGFTKYEKLPCWSLAALLDVISYPTLSQEYDGKWSCREYQEGEEVEGYDNPVDACVEMIIELHEQKLL